MRPGLVKKIDNMPRVAQAVALLASRRVMVGVPQEKDDTRTDGRMGNADIGYIHENGAPEAGIPARPHMRPGILSARPRINKLLASAARLAFAGKIDGVMRALHAVGLTGQNEVRARITSGPFQPLAASTLAGRRRRGRTGEKPLIDTGQYRAAISYVIRTVKGVRR